MAEQKVYILVAEPYHDNSIIVGVYSNLDDAILASPIAMVKGVSKSKWRDPEEHHVVAAGKCRPTKNNYFAESFEIYEWEVK